jgi:hypothetical protein
MRLPWGFTMIKLGVSHLLHGFPTRLQAFVSNVLILFRIYAYCSHAGPCVAGVSQWAS